MAFEAKYKSSQLVYGNPESSVGIVTLWTRADEVAKKLDPASYCVIGQFFSAERGLDLLVRNLLANPAIANIVITGVDYSKSGIVLRDFFERGFHRGKAEVTDKECWRVDSAFPGYIELDIPEEALQALRESVVVTWMKDMSAFNAAALPKPSRTREKTVFEKKEVEIQRIYIGEDAGYMVRHEKIAGCWVQLLDLIMKFGRVSETHYEASQKELLNLVSVISGEDPDNFHIPDFWDRRRIEEYIPRVTQDLKTSSSYTYGSRMRSWFGLDQVNAAIDKLVRQPISRAVVINLWDSTKDLTIGGSPCINHLWLRLRENRLYVTATIRSNDMFESYPENAFGLRALQELIRKAVASRLNQDIALGDLVIHSESAHIYDDCVERAKAITEKYGHRYILPANLQWDLRGSLLIDVYQGELVVHQLSPSNEVVGFYKGKTAKELREILVREQAFGNMAHAVYAGIELMKAEACLKLGRQFVQDEEFVV